MSSPRTTAAVATALLLMLMSGCSCCNDSCAVSERSIALADSLWSPYELLDSTGGPTNVDVDLYVDGSQSMAGFAGGVAPTEFDNVLDKITFTVGIDSLYRFGQFGGGYFERFPASAAMRQPSFYNRTYNPDQRLFSRLLSDTTGRTAIYMTDGVLSDAAGLNQASVVTQLTEHLSHGGALGMLIFRSTFQGRAWSEQRQAWIGNVDVAARPFYVVLIAPSEAALDVLFQKLGALKFDADHLYRFRPNAVKCAPELARDVPREERIPRHRWVSAKMTDVIKEGKQDRLLTYTCNVADDFPLTGFVADVRTTLYSWDIAKKDFGPPQPSPASVRMHVLRGEVAVQGRESSAPIATDIALGGGLYSFLDVRANAPIGRLRPALDSLTADSDADPANFERTYRMGWLIEELARHQVQRPEASLPLFLTLEHN